MGWGLRLCCEAPRDLVWLRCLRGGGTCMAALCGVLLVQALVEQFALSVFKRADDTDRAATPDR